LHQVVQVRQRVVDLLRERRGGAPAIRTPHADARPPARRAPDRTTLSPTGPNVPPAAGPLADGWGGATGADRRTQAPSGCSRKEEAATLRRMRRRPARPDWPPSPGEAAPPRPTR
jgi:hypothetical protein